MMITAKLILIMLIFVSHTIFTNFFLHLLVCEVNQSIWLRLIIFKYGLIII